MSCMDSSCTPSVQSCDDQVSSSALAEQLTGLSIGSFLAWPVAPSNSFHKNNRNVVRQRPARCETLYFFKQFLFQVFGAQRCLTPNNKLDTVFAEHFAIRVFRLREAIRVRKQDVPGI